MPRGEGRDFEFRDVREMNPFAVQPSYAPAPVAAPLAVQPSYAPMGGDYELSPEVLAQLADLGVNPYGGGQSPFAVQGVMPEMDPAEFSSLAVPGVPAAVKEQAKADLAADPNVTIIPGSLDDLSQFGGLGGLDGYEANSSGAPVGMPTSYAFPENYGNPKNKVYQLSVNADDNIRLKFVDGSTIFEGQGPEAAAKAAAMVQEFGKKFGTQSTWILDKQTAGGDWKQVSQDTVGEKKKTALNAFLDVAAPIAGALLAVVPGLGLLAAPGLLGGAGAGLGLSTATAGALGAAGGSLLNSGLQNQNSAEAFKKAALAAATTYIGAKVGDLVKGGVAASSTDPTSAVGIRNLTKQGLSPEKILQLGKSIDPLMKLTDVTEALATKAATTGLSSAAGDVVIKGLTTGANTAGAVIGGTAAAGLAGAGGLTSGTSGVTNAATNTQSGLDAAETQSGLDAANDAAVNDVQVAGTRTAVDTGSTGALDTATNALTGGVTNAVTNAVADTGTQPATETNDVQIAGNKAPLDTGVGLDIAGGLGGNGITSGVNPDFVSKPEDVVIEADKKLVDQTLAVPVPVPAPITTPVVNPDFVSKPETTVIKAEERPTQAEAEGVPITTPVTTSPLAVKPETTVIKAEETPTRAEAEGVPLTTGPLTTTQPTVPGKTDAELEIEARKKAELDRATGVPITTPTPGTPVNLTPDTTVVPAEEPKDPRVAGPVTQAALTDALTNGISDLTITAPRPTTPIKVEPLQAPDPKLDAITAGLNGLLGEPTPKTPMEKAQDWIKAHPLEAASLGLTLIGGIGGAGSGGGSGGSGGNTLSYPGGGQPGTSGSLGGIFTSKLPAATGSAALAVTPRDMGQRDWLRYGFGPEASFFSNVPDRQALAVNPAPVAAAQTAPLAVNPTPAPAIASMPALSDKLNEPTPKTVPADGTPSPNNPSIVWNGGVNGGWMQTERGMIQPDETLPTRALARGGRTGGTSYKPRSEFAVHGAGTGRSDDIPAVLSDGEYVMDAETVALLGDGSSKAGAKKLDELRVNLRRHKGANLAKGRFSVNAKSPEKYLAGGRV
jgi:hypothetical protein